MGLYVAAYLAYATWHSRTPEAFTSGWLSDVAYLVPNLVASGLFWVAARRTHDAPRTRRALGLMALQSIVTAVASSIWWYVDVIQHGNAVASVWANAVYLSSYAILLAALFSFQSRPRVNLEWWKLAMDAAIVLLCGAVEIWFFVLGQGMVLHQHTSSPGLAMAYPLADLLALVGITTVALRPSRQITRPLQWLIISQLICIMGDLIYATTYLVVPSPLGFGGGLTSDLLTGLSYAVLVASAEGFCHGLAPAAPVAPADASTVEDVQPVRPLPYIGSGAVLALLTFVAWQSRPSTLGTLIMATLPLPLVLAARQFIAVRQNARLLTERAERTAEARLRTQLQDQLMHSQRLEAVGQLAGGVAHDFNNIMTAISTNAELAVAAIASDSPAREDLAEIRVAVGRASALTRQLLAFSRRQVLHPRVLDLNSVITGCERMLGRLIGEQLEIEQVLADAVPSILADPGQLEQVLVNLVVNARDAMPTGGRITVETGPVTIDAEQAAALTAMHPGSYVRLAVRDTGVGMDTLTAARAFEPFFTTKPQGKGTGLGLSTVYGIVKQSGGYIYVDTAPDRGATFNIYFPLATGPALPATVGEPVDDSSIVPRGAETILVVEDESGVRAATTRALRHQGYRVLEATDGIHGLAVSVDHQGPIHLVVSDVVMPHMAGPMMVERIRRQRVEIKALFISGYAAPHAGEVAEQADIAVLEKPFTLTALVRRVRDVLDQPPREAANSTHPVAERPQTMRIAI